jgi:microcompartment protein CcmL/EutN
VPGSAIGLIETRGLVGVIEAADTAAKTADVRLLGFERIGGGFVSLSFRGDTASVTTAVEAAREAASRVGEVVSAHVIPSPRIDVEALAPAAPDPRPERDAPELPELPEDLEALPVTRLRGLARQTAGVGLQGRQISRANKQQLIQALRQVPGGA